MQKKKRYDGLTGKNINEENRMEEKRRGRREGEGDLKNE